MTRRTLPPPSPILRSLQPGGHFQHCGGAGAVQRLTAAWPSLAFGVEMALRDLATGGRQRLWDTPFARGETGQPTHGLIWMDDVDGILRQVEAKIAAGLSRDQAQDRRAALRRRAGAVAHTPRCLAGGRGAS
jgi:hypothetical protein